MNLSARYIKQLKKLGHNLQPVINIGKNNLTPAVIQAIDKSLTDHELIKVKIQQTSELDIEQLGQTLQEELHVRILRGVGHTLLLYRQNPDETLRKIHFN
ncbi:MAG: YhbY family RNA-binding protein [Candidatus Delongbacteria bacterium]|nr:YhbY family RNA-binding protein [Candidatus Delongbacteria bacterium]